MTPNPETRFLTALAQAATQELGADHPLTRAAITAADDPAAPEPGLAVHQALDLLADDIRDRLLARTHKTMREDLSAIWSLLPGAAQAGGMH